MDCLADESLEMTNLIFYIKLFKTSRMLSATVLLCTLRVKN